MQSRIKSLLQSKDITYSQAEKKLDFANGSLKKSDEKIQAYRLKAMADFFHVSMEYLLTGQESKYAISPFEYALILAYRQSDWRKQEIVDMVLKLEEKKKEVALRA